MGLQSEKRVQRNGETVMKRLSIIVAACALALALAGCSGASGGSQSGEVTVGGSSEQGEEQVVNTETPDEAIQAIQGDFNDTAQKLYDKQAELFAAVGDTFEGYNANIDAINEWYALTVSETEALGQRTLENSKTYFQSVINTVEKDDQAALSEAIEKYYDAIYEAAYGDYYDAVYEDLYSAMYDQFYDGIISDAYDFEEYSKVSEAASSAYESYSDFHSDVYDAISDARSDVYDLNSDAWSAYYDKDFTMDNIFRESVVNVEKSEG